MTPGVAAGIAFAVAIALTPVMRAISLRIGAVDHPNERSSHDRPTPRSGGVAILTAVAVAVILSSPRGVPVPEAVAVLLIGLVGFIDDLRGLGASIRLAVHAGAAALVAMAGSTVIPGQSLVPGVALPFGVAVAVTIIWMTGVTNGYNFMDGINGIASLQAIATGVTLAILFADLDPLAAIAAAALAGATAGFLPWNFPRATIFMGDVASGALGLAFAALVALYAARGGSFIAAALVLTPFLLDSGVTLLRRAVRGENITLAHRSHFYQRLTTLGWSHAAVSSIWFALAIVSGIGGLLWEGAARGERLAIVLCVLLLHAAVFGAITAVERRGRKN